MLCTLALAQDSALERGLEAFRKRDFRQAEQAFQDLIRAQPTSARAWKLLGMTYSAQNDFRKSEEPFRRACSLDPREENACYYLGRVYYSLSRFEEARRAFEIALRQSADRSRAAHGLALALAAMDRNAEAEVQFREAIRLNQRQALIDYGLFLAKLGRGQESLAALRKAGAKAEIDRVSREFGALPRPSGWKAAAPPVRFRESTLDMVVRNGATGGKHLIETMLAGIAAFDYDGDGWPDLFISNGAEIPSLRKVDESYSNRLFRNNRDRTFTDVTARAGLTGSGYAMGAAAADYDNDGHPDLFVTGVRGNTLYHNRGDGTFEDVTGRAGLSGDSGWSVAAAWFDFDRDGLLDLFVVRYVSWNPASEIYCGLEKPGYRTYCHPSYYQPLPNALYRNQGDGTFRDVSNESGIAAHRGKGMGVAVGDYDGDGWPDVFVANDTLPNFLFHNEHNGRFRESALAAGVAYNDNGEAVSSMGADLRDFDNDGREDLFVTALTNETFPLFRNLGGRFADITAPSLLAAATLRWTGWGLGIYDLNNDGFKDLFAANGNVNDNAELTSSRASRQPNAAFVNRGDGTFRVEVLPGEAFHRGAAFADFDRDGRIDIAVTRLNEKPIVLWNITEGAGHAISFRLVGRRSNLDGIGARVHLVAGGMEQWNRATGSVGYSGSSELVVHFGLGAARSAERVEVEWPSGARQILTNVAGDRVVTVKEP